MRTTRRFFDSFIYCFSIRAQLLLLNFEWCIVNSFFSRRTKSQGEGKYQAWQEGEEEEKGGVAPPWKLASEAIYQNLSLVSGYIDRPVKQYPELS